MICDQILKGVRIQFPITGHRIEPLQLESTFHSGDSDFDEFFNLGLQFRLATGPIWVQTVEFSGVRKFASKTMPTA